jgi:hypothetical protein
MIRHEHDASASPQAALIKQPTDGSFKVFRFKFSSNPAEASVYLFQQADGKLTASTSPIEA